MDRDKSIGKTTNSLANILNGKDFKIVLDINHCYTNDKTMKLARKFYKNFKNKIYEIHLSGYISLHEPLFKTRQIKILKAIPDNKLPIIIESECKSLDEVKKEYHYIKNYLLNRNI